MTHNCGGEIKGGDMLHRWPPPATWVRRLKRPQTPAEERVSLSQKGLEKSCVPFVFFPLFSLKTSSAK